MSGRPERLERLRAYRKQQIELLQVDLGRLCRCGHTAGDHLIRLEDGEVFNCCDERCDCAVFDVIADGGRPVSGVTRAEFRALEPLRGAMEAAAVATQHSQPRSEQPRHLHAVDGTPGGGVA